MRINDLREGRSVYLYGAGRYGREILRSLGPGIRPLAFIDAQFEQLKNVDGIPVCSPDALKAGGFDAVIIAIDPANLERLHAVLGRLAEVGVPWDKVILDPKYFYDHIDNATPNIQSGWDAYYDEAEKAAEPQFIEYFKPPMEKYAFDLSSVLDFPCGRGRIAQQFSRYAEKMTLVDANKEAVDFCANRFASFNAYRFLANEVSGQQTRPIPIPDGAFTFAYSWDAMVHFSYKWLDFYIAEFYRMLKQGGHAFIHHANLASDDVDCEKHELFSDNPSWRSNVSKEDVRFIAVKNGFEVPEQRVIPWGLENLDCITILIKR